MAVSFSFSFLLFNRFGLNVFDFCTTRVVDLVSSAIYS